MARVAGHRETRLERGDGIDPLAETTAAEWTDATFLAAEKLYTVASRLGGFVNAVTLLGVIGTIFLAAAAGSDAAAYVGWVGGLSTVSFFLFGSLVSRAARAYATDLMRRTA